MKPKHIPTLPAAFLSRVVLMSVLLLAGCETSATLPTGVDPAPNFEAIELPPLLLETNPDLIGLEGQLAELFADAQARRISMSVQPAAAGTIQVPGDFATIQEAVDNSSPGDVIEVHGTQSADLQIFVFTPGITLDGGGGAKIEGDILWVFADDVTITRFHMDGMRIWTDAANTEISHIHSQGLEKRRSIIATLQNSSGAMIHDNKVDNAGDGVFLFGHDHTVVDNVLTNLARSGVFFASGSTGNHVTACKIAQASRGLLLNDAHGNLIEDCHITGSTLRGVTVFNSTGNTFRDVTATGNRIGVRLFSNTQDNVFENLVARGSRICDIVDEGTNNTFTNATFRTINC